MTDVQPEWGWISLQQVYIADDSNGKQQEPNLRIKAVGKAALTRSQPISFYHLEGLKVGKP